MPISRLRLRGTDLELSRLVAGVWRLREWGKSPEELRRYVEGCVELGITSFDHADLYGGYYCEAAFGEAVDAGLRNRIELVTKCGIRMIHPARPEHRVKHYDTSRAHIERSVENSLKNLRTDRIDLLLIHRPDPALDADEVAEAFHALRASGKVRHFGVSNFPSWDIELLESRLELPLVTNQLELHVGRLDSFSDGTLAQAQRLRMPPMAWSPLAGGALVTSAEPRWQRIREALTQIGRAHHASVEQVALAWLLAHPSKPIPVVGTGRMDRIQELARAEGLELDRQSWFAIWEASAGQPVP
jgi:predicted oxidoreductase